MNLPTLVRHIRKSICNVLTYRSVTTSLAAELRLATCPDYLQQARQPHGDTHQASAQWSDRSQPYGLSKKPISSLKCQGFSLIELMIAIAIVAIITTIGVPYYGEYKDRTTVGDALALMKDIRLQLTEQYIWEKSLPVTTKSYNTLIPPNSGIAQLFYDGTDSKSQIVATFGTDAGSTLKDRNLWLQLDTSEPGVLTWTCTTDTVSARKIPGNVLPSMCQ